MFKQIMFAAAVLAFPTTKALAQFASADPPTELLQGAGVSQLDGKLYGIGPGYLAEFGEDGVTFSPSMPTAERLLPMHLRTVGYGRGPAASPAGGAALSEDGEVISYHRAGFVETYDVRADGVKQSFVFEQLPAGSGDLFVRLALETELVLAGQQGEPGTLTFVNGQGIGLTIGRVLGIDAAGQQCEGSMQFDGSELELRLPASFVDSATLPLVLDPLLSGRHEDFLNGYLDASAVMDAAYDESTDRYLMTFARKMSGDYSAVIGFSFRKEPAGSAGGKSEIRTGHYAPQFLGVCKPGTHPRIANVNAVDTFLVAYCAKGSHELMGRAVTLDLAARFPVRNPIQVSGAKRLTLSQTPVFAFDIGGEVSETDNRATVVFNNVSENKIQSIKVLLPLVHGLGLRPRPVGAPVVLSSSAGGFGCCRSSVPRISNGCGSTGNHCIAWSRRGPRASRHQVTAVVVDRELSVLGRRQVADLAWSNVSLAHLDMLDRPAWSQLSVDGDGRHWVVAALERTDVARLRTVPVCWNAAAAASDQVQAGVVNAPMSGAGVRAMRPTVAWMGNSTLLACEVFESGLFYHLLQQVDPFTGRRLSIRHDLRSRQVVRGDYSLAGCDNSHGLCVVSEASVKRYGASASEHEAALFWLEGPDPDYPLTFCLSYAYGASDGLVEDLGYGCSSDAVSYATQAICGNPDFTFRLRGAAPSTAVIFVMNTTRQYGARLTIGSLMSGCTIVPSFGATYAATMTDANGNAAHPMPMPRMLGVGMLGMELYSQWIISDPARIGTSNALWTKIQ